MRMIPIIKSKKLAALGFDPNTKDLVVQFARTGDYYQYQGVEDDVVTSVLFDPDSIGEAFSAKIEKGMYPYKKIDEPEGLHG